MLRSILLSLFLVASLTQGSCQRGGGGFSSILSIPPIQASSITFSEVSDQSLKISLTRGNGRYVLVTGRLTASTAAHPVANVTYTANAAFGSGTQIGTGTYVLFSGETVSNVLITGLTANTAYTFEAYEYNVVGNGTQKYNRNTATGNPAAQTTAQNIVAPTTQATAVAWDGDRRISWTSGNGLRRVVVMREGGAVNSNPVDDAAYTASIDFGTGSEIGTGNFVMYDGTGSFVEINPETLEFSTTYGVRVYEYNISGTTELYNTNTATGNPLSHVTIADQVWVSYQDTPFLTRRTPYNLSTVSREFSQLYPVGDWVGTSKHWVWLVAEGDGDVQSGIDRTIAYTRNIANDPTVKANWSPNGTPDANGDTPSFLDRGTFAYTEWSAATTYSIGDRVRYVGTSNEFVYESLTNGNINQSPPTNSDDWVEVVIWDGNQCWGPMSVVEHGGNQYGIYVANRYVANRYGVGMIWSNDEFATYARVSGNPIINSGSQLSAFYVHVHPTKVGSYWYMFIQNYTPSLIVENHLYTTEIWRTTSDPTTSGWSGWTKLTSVDQLSGRGWTGAIDISQSWDDAGKFWAYISVNDPGANGAYQSRGEGTTEYLSTYPVGKRILLISWTDWTNFKDGYIVERVIYKTSQQTQIDTRTWCPKRTFSGNDFFVSMSFLWKGQTLLGGNHTMEPMNDGKIISRSVNTTGAVQIGNEIYPNWVKFAKPHQSHVNDVLGTTPSPYNVITSSAGTVVGSPRAARMNSIQAVDNGFITFPNADFTYDQNYLAVTVIVGRTGLTGEFGVCGMDTDVGGGEHGWHIRQSSQYNYDIYVYADDNVSYKQYRVNYVNNIAKNDATQFMLIGFKFVNGTLSVRIDDNLDCPVTKVHDDSFTTMNLTDQPLRLGAIYPTTNDEKWCQEVVGSFLMFSGSANVTDDHWLNNNLIGY